MMFSSLSFEDRDIDPVVKTYFECRHGDIPEGDGLDSCVICNPVWTEEPTTRLAPNPALVAFRDLEPHEHGAFIRQVEDFIDEMEAGTLDPRTRLQITVGQMYHARKVLTRWRKVYVG